MTKPIPSAENLVELSQQRSTSRRRFLQAGAALGLSAPLASLLWQGAQAAPSASGRTYQFAAQDGGKTLVLPPLT